MHNKAYEYKKGQDYSFQPFCVVETSFFKESDVFSVLRSKLKYILQEIEKESNVYLHFALDNYYLYDIFLDDLDRWLYSKLDLDIILDMISAKGIDSLREIDKKFLKDNYQTDDN
jgi:hypothetical protein